MSKSRTAYSVYALDNALDNEGDGITELKNKTENKSTVKTNSKGGARSLDGRGLFRMLRSGLRRIYREREEINRLNVFPVPDGDTGDNMYATLESGIASMPDISFLSTAADGFSEGALLGARGNSGVILSQLFAGFASSLRGADSTDAAGLIGALGEGVRQAYLAVVRPKEGTMLTVAREGVQYAASRLHEQITIEELFSNLREGLSLSLEKTPSLLKPLRDAGVVDSGGAGLLCIIDGCLCSLHGEEGEGEYYRESALGYHTPLDISRFRSDSEMKYGYCTELLVRLMKNKCIPSEYDIGEIRNSLEKLGDSLVLAKTGDIVKLHLHTMMPEEVLKTMHNAGEFLSVKIENMSLQHTDAGNTAPSPNTPNDEKKTRRYGIIAVTEGEGLRELFYSLGADYVMDGKRNPSVGEFISAFKECSCEELFVLPNGSNVISAANMAKDMYRDVAIHVIPTNNIAQGYVALSVLSLENGEPEEIIADALIAMKRATYAYVSEAERDAALDGVEIRAGEYIGVVEGKIVLSRTDEEGAVRDTVDLLLKAHSMITVVLGKGMEGKREMIISHTQKMPTPPELYFIEGAQRTPFILIAE